MPIFRGNPELLGRFREGQRDALEEVYRAYVDKVAQIIRFGFKVPRTDLHIVGLARRAGDVPDAIQDVFIKTFSEKARRSFDDRRDFGPYLFTITRNVLVDILRKGGHEIPMASMTIGQLADSSIVPNPDEPWADEATIAIVRRYVSGLDGDLKRVHEARYREGLSQRVAASQLGLSRQEIRTLEERLREGLRREIGKSEGREV